MSSATWILGSLFFLFVIGFIMFVLTTDVKQPEPAKADRMGRPTSSSGDLATVNGKRLISRSYQVIFSPRVFVNYPFGIRVVFAKSGMPEPVVMYKMAEVNGNPRSNVQRRLQEEEYYGWPQSAVEDPELSVIGGEIEFESEREEPTVRVELKSARESFHVIEAVKQQALKRDEDTVFSFWLNPLTAESSSLVIGFSQVAESVNTTTGNGNNSREIAVIPLTVPVRFFPIALR